MIDLLALQKVGIRYLLLGILCITITASATAQIPDFEWAKSYGGIVYAHVTPRGIRHDSQGNIVTAGTFNKTTDFDPGPGVFNLTSSIFSLPELYIQKLDSNGLFLWAKHLVAGPGNSSQCLVMDDDDNSYVAGSFQYTQDLDPGPGTASFSAINVDAMVVKLDANGDFVWAKVLESSFTVRIKRIERDHAGNLVIAGNFRDTVDFDPGPGVHTMVADPGQDDLFFAKLDPDGNFLWSKTIKNNVPAIVDGIGIDKEGEIYFLGEFQQTMDFDPGAGTTSVTSSGALDIFIEKLDADGNFLWVKTIGCVAGGSDLPQGCSVDIHGNILVIADLICSTTDLDPGPGVFNVANYPASKDVYIVKLNPNGDFVWGKIFGSNGTDHGIDFLADDWGNIITVGTFHDRMDVDPGPDSTILFTHGVYPDLYLQKLDSNGNFLWGTSIGGIGNDDPFTVDVNADGTIYVGGNFTDTVDFDPGAGVFTILVDSASDAFAWKLKESIVLGIEDDAEARVQLYPNPNNGNFAIDMRGLRPVAWDVEVLNVFGQSVWHQPLVGGSIQRLDLGDVADGIYFMRLVSKDTVIQSRFVKE